MSLIWMLPLGLIGLAACSRREEVPPPASASQPAPAMAEPLRSSTPAAAAPAFLEAPAASAGADLEKVAEQSAAFENMVDSLRTFAGEDVELNAATADLDALVRGKSDRDLLKFAAGAQDKSPYAALQVLDYLLTHSADPKIRMKAAARFGDVASDYGNAQDRQRGHECFDLLADLRGDESFVAVLSPGERNELLTSMQRLLLRLSLPPSAYQQMADVYRDHPTSAEDLTYADWFEAMGLLRTGKEENSTRMIACFRAIRERGVYGSYFASQKSIDYWLSMSDEQIKEDFARMQKMAAAAQAKTPDFRSMLKRLAGSNRAPQKE